MSEFKDDEISLYKKLTEITENYSIYSDQIAVIVRYVIEDYTLKQKKKPTMDDLKKLRESTSEIVKQTIEAEALNSKILKHNLDLLNKIDCELYESKNNEWEWGVKMIDNFNQIIEEIKKFEPRNSILYDLISVISPQNNTIQYQQFALQHLYKMLDVYKSQLLNELERIRDDKTEKIQAAETTKNWKC